MNHLIKTASRSASAERRFPTLRRVARYFAIERGRGAIKGLDGLRGIAILLVLGRHGIRPFYDPADPVLPIGSWDASIPFINGWMGVDLFFVLSGFLISHHIIRRWSDGFGAYLAITFFLTLEPFAAIPLAALVVYQTINFHHYIVDGLIWKKRRRTVQLMPGAA